MIDFRLYTRVETLEDELDSMRDLVHTLRQQQAGMLDQIKKLKKLKEINSDGSGK